MLVVHIIYGYVLYIAANKVLVEKQRVIETLTIEKEGEL